MAEYLNDVLKAGLQVCALAVVLVLGSASAETLVDPTRPPAGFGQNDATSADISAPVLQSILISATRRIAIISGKTLHTGDKFGDAQLVSINDNEVVLRTGKELQVLKLYPSLHKHALTGASSHAGSNFDSPAQQR
jgi:MSHA biogenesis protein MshK